MAWLFSLSAEFGPDSRAAARFDEHFRGFQFGSCEFANRVWQDKRLNDWWVAITSDKIPDDEETVSKALYNELRRAPDYRYAIVGVEVDLFRDYEELINESEDMLQRLKGLVVSRDIWERLKRPASFTEFRPGYVWQPSIEE